MVLTAYSPVGKGKVNELATLNQLARQVGATPAQVALSWLIHQPNIITIPKSLDPDHLRQNLEALDLILGEEELALLNRLAEAEKGEALQ